MRRVKFKLAQDVFMIAGFHALVLMKKGYNYCRQYDQMMDEYPTGQRVSNNRKRSRAS